MNKITVVAPKSKARMLSKLFKKHGIKRFVKIVAGDYCKYELILTELRTQEVLNLVKQELGLRPGKALSEGYVTIQSTNLVAPLVSEKTKVVELDELIHTGAKKFIQLDRNYLIFTICAGIIACLGFQLDSLVVLIGSMIISPLMAPIMAVSYGMSKTNNSLIWRGLKNELVGVSLIILTSVLMSLFPNPSLELETSLAQTNLFFVLLLAIIIGVVAANSFMTSSYEALTGVAVSISLLPPLTNFVLLIMEKEFVNAVNSLFSFIFNICGMHLSALVTFLVLSYFKRQ